MLKMADTDINKFLPLFSQLNLDVSFLVPTATGYKKAIMDATLPLRDFLKSNNIHDYSEQYKGQANKVTFPTFFINSKSLIETTTSLYRPETKNGDPRIWIAKLTKYCNPYNLLAIVTNKNILYVINLSDTASANSLLNNGYLKNILDKFSKDQNAISNELLGKIQSIHNCGFIKTVTSGDTGVGMTLEHLLGLQPNTSKLPDYKGIELKASRKKKTNINRVNLFTQVPDWANSKGMTALKLLDEYGYWVIDSSRNSRFNLYCTVGANVPNPQGLFFDVDIDHDLLINRSRINNVEKYVLQWSLATLRNRLSEKHTETFWVKATSIRVNDIEYFCYDSVIHTKKPNITLIGLLLESQVITMDYTMHKKPSGLVRDHGYIFKIKPSNVELLFPKPLEYVL